MIISFFSIAVGGFVILMFSLLFGGEHDVSVDHDFDLHDMDHDTSSGVRWFSVKALATFATAFGATGTIACIYKISEVWTFVIATCSGLILAAMVNTLINAFMKQQSTSTYRSDDLTGKTGTVVLGILPGGTGEVRVDFGGGFITKRAQSRTGEAIRQGELVKIISAASPMIVEKTDAGGESASHSN